MLNLYRKSPNGIVAAAYNGRYALSISIRDRVLFTTGEYPFRKDWRFFLGMTGRGKMYKGESIKRMAHEFCHKHLSSLFRTSLILTGYRLYCRIMFLCFGAVKPLKAYYRMRTIQLMETKELQEVIVDTITGMLGEEKSSATLEDAISEIIDHTRQDITAADQKVLNEWEARGLGLTVSSRFLYAWAGRVLHRSFAIKYCSYYPPTGEWFLSTMKDKAILNDLYMISSKKRFEALIKKTIGFFISPIQKRGNLDKILIWFSVGQRMQYQTLSSAYGLPYEEFHRQILTPTIFFIFKWAGVPPSMHHQLIEFYEDTLLMNENELSNKWTQTLDVWKIDKAFARFLYYFYLHGN